MRYSRTFKNSQQKSKVVQKNFLSWFFKLIFSSRFSSHVLLVVLTFLVMLFSQQVLDSNLSVNASSAQDAWGTLEKDSVTDQGNVLAYQISNDAIVKPKAPYTKESAVRKPTDRNYKVQAGDTFASISEKFGSNESDLRKANNAGADEVLIENAVLNIPVAKGVWYDVQQGDTVDAIAKRFKVDPELVIKNNDIVDPQGLAIGRKLVLPGVFATPVTVASSSSTSSTTQRSSSSTSSSVSRNKVQAQAPSGGSASFGWPVSPGSAYRSQGFHGGHPGWDLASYGGKNVPIFAAAGGKVIFSGWAGHGGCGSYGNKVMISHPNGYTTLYGHFYKVYVGSGEQVSRGQVIGLMGTTGCSTGVHLHFEICTKYGCPGYDTGSRLNPGRFFSF
ncbi:MAG: M23 family metallopeptidase [bacterium]